MREKKHKQALDYFKVLLKDYPNNPTIHVLISGNFMVLGELREAIKFAEAAAHLAPQDEFISRTLFFAHWNYGDKVSAYNELRRFSDLEINLDDYRLMLLNLTGRIDNEECHRISEKIGSREIVKCNLTQWSYDTLDRATGKRYHDGTTEAYAYAGGLLSQTRGTRGQLVSYSYDANGNQTLIGYPNMADVSLSYNALDQVSQVSQVSDGVGTHGFNYNGYGRLTSQSGPFANDTQSYAYDVLQRLSGQSVGRGASGGTQSQSYAYDALGAWHRSTPTGGTERLMKQFTNLLIATLLFVSSSLADTHITGVEAQCTVAAVKRFQKDFKNKYDLNNYKTLLYLQEGSNDNMIVAFLSKAAEGEPIPHSGKTSFGETISYVIRLKDYKVIKTIYTR